MPSSTRATGKSTSFIARKTSSSSESRLTVIRFSPAAFSASALRGKERAVRRQRQVEPVDPGEQRDERLEVAAEERLAARDADLLDAEPGEDACEALDLLEGQQVGAGEEGVVAAEDLLRHAVDAAEVAAVGDRDPEVPHRPPQLVGQPLHG